MLILWVLGSCPASLHPAGALEIGSSHSLQQQDTFDQEQISSLLCRLLPGSPVAAPASGSPSSPRPPPNPHPNTRTPLPPSPLPPPLLPPLLLPPPHLTPTIQIGSMIFSHSSFEKSEIIEVHRNWTCVAMQKEYIKRVYMDFPQCDIPSCSVGRSIRFS